MGQVQQSVRTVLSNVHDRFRSEDGTATVEAVLWLPFFLAAFTLVIDATMIMHNQSYALRVVQDANRALSIGKFTSENAAEDFIESTLEPLSSNADASTALVDGIISTSVSIPASDLEVIGVFGGLSAATLTIRAQHLFEE